MPRIFSDSQIRDCVELFSKGYKAPEVSRMTGISRSACYRIAKKHGIKTSHTPMHKTLDRDQVIRKFYSGRGVRGIATDMGVSPSVISNLLTENGIALRNRSEQQQARMDNSSAEEIARLTAKAHAASAGHKKSSDELRKLAKSRFINQSARSSYLEETFDKLMSDRGYHGVRQFPIDKYNADFVFGNIAVEIFGGTWHWTGVHAARAHERIKTILDSGFHLVVIAARSQGVSGETADHTVSLIEELGCDKSAIRHYRMIASNGQLAISQRSDDDYFSIEWPFRNVRDATTGRYVAVR